MMPFGDPVPVTQGAPQRNNAQGAVAVTTTGVKLTWTAGSAGGRVTGASAQQPGASALSATARVRIAVTTGGGTRTLVSGTGALSFVGTLELAAGDTVTIEVITNDAVGQAMDGFISGVSY